MITAIVLAAGQSTRMGHPKMTLPWGEKTVIAKVISSLVEVGLSSIIVVAGGNLKDLKNALREFQVKFVINQNYIYGDMLSSVKVGLSNTHETSTGALIVLGDQPQIETQVVKRIMEKYRSTLDKIIVPSYNMHRGHPWLIDRSLWGEILDLKPSNTLHDYLYRKQNWISYLYVDNSSILQDIDTPEDYILYRP
jgi:molybdenum cofactor cytidylyltransferase